MAEENEKKLNIREIWKNLIEEFQITLIRAGIQKSIAEYILIIFIPIMAICIGLGIVIGILITTQTTLKFMIWLSPLIGTLIGLSLMIFLPFILQSSRNEKINNTLPVLVTYMGGISTSKASRDQLFLNVSQREKSFGLIALEIKRIVALATEWNFGYIIAIKKVASTTASSRFGDFLSRFSQALDAGEELEQFFKKEQESVLSAYISDYTRRLKGLETLNNAFAALSTSMSFMSITFLLMMFLFGGDQKTNTENLFLILIIIEMINVVLMLAFHIATPKDDLISIQRKTAEYEKVVYSFLICVGIFMPILAGLTFFLKNESGEQLISLPIFMIIFGIAMIYPGIVAEKFENLVKRRDINFPVFIRTLGGTTTLLGGSIFDSVKIISREQFGPLTTDIKLLYTQAKFGIDPIIAWQWFSDTTCSSLIDRFLRIFTSSMDIGGNSGIVSNFISTNVEKILKLRRDREQVINVFKGTLLMLTIINILTMIFMKDVLHLLNVTMGSLSTTPGMNLQLGNPPNIFFTSLFFNIYYLTIPFFACLAIQIPQRGTWLKITRYLSQYYIIIGLEIIIVGKFAQAIIISFGVTFDV